MLFNRIRPNSYFVKLNRTPILYYHIVQFISGRASGGFENCHRIHVWSSIPMPLAKWQSHRLSQCQTETHSLEPYQCISEQRSIFGQSMKTMIGSRSIINHSMAVLFTQSQTQPGQRVTLTSVTGTHTHSVSLTQ